MQKEIDIILENQLLILQSLSFLMGEISLEHKNHDHYDHNFQNHRELVIERMSQLLKYIEEKDERKKAC